LNEKTHMDDEKHTWMMEVWIQIGSKYPYRYFLTSSSVWAGSPSSWVLLSLCDLIPFNTASD
jgi:hypothetical protein